MCYVHLFSGVSEGIIVKTDRQSYSEVYPKKLLYAKSMLSKHRCCFRDKYHRALAKYQTQVDLWGWSVVV